jgi:hypothetical protein
MSSGDAQRVWFSEIVDRLRSQWQDGLSIHALLTLRAELDGMLRHIRAARTFAPRSSRVACAELPARNPSHTSASERRSRRRFDSASRARTWREVLERDWTTYRRQNGLNLFAQPLDPQRTGAGRCLHPAASNGGHAK